MNKGVRFDPDIPQTIRLEFAKSNTKVSKPKQQNSSPPAAAPHPTLLHPLTGREYFNSSPLQSSMSIFCLQSSIFNLSICVPGSSFVPVAGATCADAHLPHSRRAPVSTGVPRRRRTRRAGCGGRRRAAGPGPRCLFSFGAPFFLCPDPVGSRTRVKTRPAGVGRLARQNSARNTRDARRLSSRSERWASVAQRIGPCG